MKKAPSQRSAKAVQKPCKALAKRGNMKPVEIVPLAIQARQAYEFQCGLGNVEAGVSFDAWRRDQVMAAVEKPGLSACDSDDWRSVMGHFLLLAGQDESALEQFIKTGKSRDHGDEMDTHESRSQLAHLIRQNLRMHMANKGDWEPIREGYILAIARNKFHVASLRSLADLEASLTVKQLTDLLSTVRNRISTREGRADPFRRKPRKSAPQPSPPLPGCRDPF